MRFRELVFVNLLFLVAPSYEQCSGVPVRLHPHQCCNIPVLFDDAQMAKCRVKYQNVDTMRHASSHCFLMCALQAANVSSSMPQTVDGLTRALTAKFIVNGEGELATAVTNAIFTCLNTPPRSTRIGQESSTDFYCDPNALLIKGCIQILVAAGCPTDRRVDTPGCADWSMYWQQCKPPNVV